jgi:hypothetical protein
MATYSDIPPRTNAFVPKGKAKRKGRAPQFGLVRPPAKKKK